MSENNNFESLESLIYKSGSFKILNQLKVPNELVYEDVNNVEDAVDAIKTMKVRGAPLIAMVGSLGIAIELNKTDRIKSKEDLLSFISEKVDACIAARPTAVNMKIEGLKLIEFVKNIIKERENEDLEQLKLKITEWIENLLEIDVTTNKLIGKNGGDAIMKNYEGEEGINILTHCNTGSLATAGYGTALGVIRDLYSRNKIKCAYFTETRPYNQGTRLTSFELKYDGIPSCMICDSAVSWLMKNKNISAVVTGADRVVLNGDTANKIGTYQLAIAAKEHNIPFYIAAPLSTIDPTIPNGDQIEIEFRSSEEVTTIFGKRISPEGINVLNPAFDCTPARLITGIITEKGVFEPAQLQKYLTESHKG